MGLLYDARVTPGSDVEEAGVDDEKDNERDRKDKEDIKNGEEEARDRADTCIEGVLQ